MKCQCHPRRPAFRTVKYGARIPGGKTSPGLGFTIDWGGIATNAIQAFGAVTVARNNLRVQQAQQAAALRAQQNEFELMQRRQTQTIAPPVSGFVSTPQGIMQVAPSGTLVPVVQQAPNSSLPSWALPAALGVGVLFLMRN